MGVLDAVADPVRLRIVRHLAHHESATLTELADVAGVHVNTIRGHVASLEEADLLASTQKAASGPGRPATVYRLAEGWALSSTDFLELAGLLAAALVRTRPDADALRATGSDWGRYLTGRPGRRDVATELPLALERLGFRLTIALSLAFLLGVVERKGFTVTAAVSIVFAGAAFFLFDTLLRVPLPRGPFGL